MTDDPKRKLRLVDPNQPFIDDEDSSGQAGSGGKSGEIEFRFTDAALGPQREDLLPASEIKRLLTVHKDTHKGLVDKQKQTIAERKILKENKYSAKSQYQQGLGSGSGSVSPYKGHPVLSTKAQFDGVDKQVVGLTTKNESVTNPEMQEELVLQNQPRLQNAPQPGFNPQPKGPGR